MTEGSRRPMPQSSSLWSLIPRGIGVHGVLFLVGLYTTFAVLLREFADDPGLGWHLRAGQVLLTTWQLPRFDTFLHSEAPREWLLDQWFADLLLFAGYQQGGWTLLYVLGGLFYLLTYFWGVYVFVRSYGRQLLTNTPSIPQSAVPLAAVLSMFLAFKMGQVHFILRPVMAGFPLFSLVLWRLVMIDTLRRQSKPWSMSRESCLLGTAFFLWVNLHPTFALGGVVIAFAVAYWTLEDLYRTRTRSVGKLLKGWFVGHWGLSFLCFAVTLLNPYGYYLHESILWLGQSKFAMNNYQEWLPPQPGTVEREFLWIPVILISLLVGLRGRSVRLVSPLLWMIGLLFFFWACSSVRILPYFGIASAFILCPLICATAAEDSVIRNWCSPSFRRLWRQISGYESQHLKAPLLAGAVILVCGFSLYTGSVPLYSRQLGPSENALPLEVVPALESELQTLGKKLVVANDMNWASLLTWFTSHEIQGLIDDRTSLLGDDFYYQYFAMMKPEGEWRSYFTRWGVTHVLVPVKKKFGQYLQEQCHFEAVFVNEKARLLRVPETLPICSNVS